MKRTVKGFLVAALAYAGMVGVGRAEDLMIESFDGAGRLVFNTLSTTAVYLVEWAPAPSGPWTNFAGAASLMDGIVATGSGSITCSVPMCYRVVAAVTNLNESPTNITLSNCKRLNFDRLDGGRFKRCAKPVTVRRAIWPG